MCACILNWANETKNLCDLYQVVKRYLVRTLEVDFIFSYILVYS